VKVFMNAQQITELTSIETALNSLLATLPTNEIKRNLSKVKKSIHATICLALEDKEDAPEHPRKKNRLGYQPSLTHKIIRLLSLYHATLPS
jgi:hypothetical protein